MKLVDILRRISSVLMTLQERKNSYYYKASTASNQYGKTLIVTTLSGLPKGIYLVLGSVGTSISASSIIVAVLSPLSNCKYLVRGNGRATMNSGGGCHTWSLVEVLEDGGTINLETYGYVNSSYTYDGKLLAIKLAV